MGDRKFAGTPACARMLFSVAVCSSCMSNMKSPGSASDEPRPALYQVLDMEDGIRTEGMVPKGRLYPSHIGDLEFTRRLWNDHGPAFDFRDWDNFSPDKPYRRVVLEWEGKRIVLKSLHPLVELDPELVVTSGGVEPLAGRDRTEALASDDDPQYLKKREAFDAIVAACAAKQAETDSHYQQSIRLKMEQEEKRRSRSFTSTIIFSLFFLAGAGIAWIIPAWAMMRAAARKGGSPLNWTLALCALSPAGWVVWTGWPHVRGWMVIMSVLAAYAGLLATRLLPAGGDKPADPPRRALLLSAALLLGYGLWTVNCGVKYYSWNLTRGSSERATLGNLSGLRSSLGIYYDDTDGKWPPDLASMIPKYLSKLPDTQTVASSDGVILHAPSGKILLSPSADDSGGWGYAPEEGRVYINCTHPDLRGEKKLCEH